MQLVEQGKLQLDSPIHDVLPDIQALEEGYKTPITLRHLLCHTAGTSYPFFNKETAEWVSAFVTEIAWANTYEVPQT